MKLSWSTYDKDVARIMLHHQENSSEIGLDGEYGLVLVLESIEGVYGEYGVYLDDLQIGNVKMVVSDEECNIEWLEVEEDFRRKGYATEIVAGLLRKFNKIVAMTRAEIVEFWNSVGADIKCKEDEIGVDGYLIPFSIRKVSEEE